MGLNIRQLIEEAFQAGWRASLEAYSVWKDGEQLTTMGRRMRDEMAHTLENSKTHFDLWLDRQRTKAEGE